MDKNLIIEKLDFTNFRGLNNLEIDGLSRVNIFAGANNSGKTSALEAIKLLGTPDDIGQLVAIALQRVPVSKAMRKKNLINYLLSIFQKVDEDDQDYYRIKLGMVANGKVYDYEVDGSLGDVIDSAGSNQRAFDVAIKTTINKNGENASYRKTSIVSDKEYSFLSIEKPLYNAQYIHSRVSYYVSCVKYLSDYIVSQGKREIITILNSFDENIDDVSIVGEDIYIHNSISGSMPLFAYGSGLQKALFLTIAIVYCKNGVILVDEIDNAIHVSAFEDVFSWFLDACIKWNVQAFITTHSAEAIDAILKISHRDHANEDLLRVITLRKDHTSNDTLKKIRTGEEAFSDRSCFEMELRV